MWLRAITLQSAPGLPHGVALPELGPGLQLVLGPNASGKSTLVRAMRQALWSRKLDAGCNGLVSVIDGGVRWDCTIVAGKPTWQRGIALDADIVQSGGL